MATILIVDDDAGFRALMDTILQGEGYETECAASAAEALAAGARRSFHLVVTDLKLPDGSGLDVLRYWKQEMPEIPVVVITGFGTVASAVEAMKLGAADYLGKPLSSPDELRIVVRKALDQNQTLREWDLLREQEDARFSCSDLIAGDPADAPGRRADAQGRPDPRHGPDHRRKRHRQRSNRTLHPPQQSAGAARLRAGELRGTVAHVDRERAVRARAWSLHRRGRAARRTL